jgi:hypothetical protein
MNPFTTQSSKINTANLLAALLMYLLPVLGVWFMNYSAKDIFTVYALETLIVGAITVLKLGAITLFRKRDTWQNDEAVSQQHGLFFILFFIVHYGLFALVQTSIFSESAQLNPPGTNMTHFFFYWYRYISKEIGMVLVMISAGLIIKELLPFIISGQYKTTPMLQVMFQPYGRIFIQQFTVIIGSMLLSFAGGSKIFILVFAAIKFYFEYFINFNAIIKRTGIQHQSKPGTDTTNKE